MYSSFRLEEKSNDISLHFSQVAEHYRDLRTTDPEPIIYITQELGSILDLPRIDIADIGCGGGRYSLLLARCLDGKVRLSCIDNNEHMLEALSTYLSANGISKFVSVKSDAESLPFGDNSFDCILTFNAVHHFKLRDFLVESARILRDRSLFFIYTRTPGQNSRNIWGRYFPQFCQKETRLYRQDERVASLERLIEKAENHHYSTFWLYSEPEFAVALAEFRQNIRNHFSNPNQVRWLDEYLLLVIEKEG